MHVFASLRAMHVSRRDKRTQVFSWSGLMLQAKAVSHTALHRPFVFVMPSSPQVPLGLRFSAAPLAFESTVVTGFGRGSRQLGVPTANMDPAPLAQHLQHMPQGVYFGWAQLDPPGGWATGDAAVHKMVMNVGRRPTVNTGACVCVCCSACVHGAVYV